MTELKEALSGADPDSVFLCGGEQTYRLLLPFCEKAYVTLTETYQKADRFFPNLNRLQNWNLTEMGERQIEDGIAFRFMMYTNSDVQVI